MAWQDRIKEAAYVSPSGVRFVFDYEDVSLSLPKKTTAFDFPDATGTYIQDRGIRGRRFPLRLFFSGEDYDLVANDFLAALSEGGAGKLEHPMYGLINVVPFGDIGRRDNLKTAANQAVFEVEFWETNDVIFPTSQQDGFETAIIAIDENLIALAAQFADALDFDTAERESIFRSTYRQQLALTKSALEPVADADETTRQRFVDIHDSISNSLSILLNEPETLSQQTTQWILLPSQANVSPVVKILAYQQVINNVVNASNAVRVPDLAGVNANLFQNDLLFAINAVMGSVRSALVAEYDTKSAAIQSAISILEQFYQVANWIDANVASLGIVDPGASYQKMLNAVSVAAGYLVQSSFSLKQERSIILVRTHTIIDLIAILYKPENVDANIDFFINSNNLTGSEILELPIGREIKYYV
jgi:hypothetical protein